MNQTLRQGVLRCVPTPVLRQALTWRSKWIARRYRAATARDVFSEIHVQNHWGSSESISGPGSELAQAREISAALPGIIRRYGISSILDAPCGDFHWMREVDLGDVDYTGADIVEVLIRHIAGRFGNARRRFVQLDLVNDKLPEADLIICRDCFIHLPFGLIHKALVNFRASGAKYVLITTCGNWPINYDTAIGGARGVDLCAWPFNFPKPIELIQEDHPSDPRAPYRSMGLWPADALPKSAK